jgi:expansin (peptidoglycan-binding protein)
MGAGTLASAQEINGTATHYGESYNGLRMGCGGVYSSNDPTIAAVGPARYAEWPCGTTLEISGPDGSIIVQRTDSCPGCSATMVDLSESGNAAVCGSPPHTCRVTIRVLE